MEIDDSVELLGIIIRSPKGIGLLYEDERIDKEQLVAFIYTSFHKLVAGGGSGSPPVIEK